MVAETVKAPPFPCSDDLHDGNNLVCELYIRKQWTSGYRWRKRQAMVSTGVEVLLFAANLIRRGPSCAKIGLSSNNVSCPTQRKSMLSSKLRAAE